MLRAVSWRGVGLLRSRPEHRMTALVGAAMPRTLCDSKAAELSEEQRTTEAPVQHICGKWFDTWKKSPRRLLGSAVHREEFLPLLEEKDNTEALVAKFVEFAKAHEPLPREYVVLVSSLCEANMPMPASQVARTFRRQFKTSEDDPAVLEAQQAINWEMLICTARLNDKTCKFWLSCVNHTDPSPGASAAACLVYFERAVKSGEVGAAMATLRRCRRLIDTSLLRTDFFEVLADRIPSFEDRLPILCGLVEASFAPPPRDLVRCIVEACLDESVETALGMLEFFAMNSIYPGAVEGDVMQRLLDEGKSELFMAYAKGGRFVGSPVHPSMKTLVETGRTASGRVWVAKPRYRVVKKLAERRAEAGDLDGLIQLARDCNNPHVFVPTLRNLVTKRKVVAVGEVLRLLDFSNDQEQLWSEVVLNASLQLVREGHVDLVGAMLDHISSSAKPSLRWKPLLPESLFAKGGNKYSENDSGKVQGVDTKYWLYQPVLATLMRKGLVAEAKPLFDKVVGDATPSILVKGVEAFHMIKEGRLEEATALVDAVREEGGEGTLRELRQAKAHQLPAFRFSDLLSPLLELALEKNETQRALAIFKEMMARKYHVYEAGVSLSAGLSSAGKYDDAIEVVKSLHDAGRFGSSMAVNICNNAIANNVDEATYEDLKNKMGSLNVSSDVWPTWQAPTQ